MELFINTYKYPNIGYFFFINEDDLYNYGYDKDGQNELKIDNVYILNNFNTTWTDDITTQLFFNVLLDNNIFNILNKYLCKIEKLYKDFIDSLIDKLCNGSECNRSDFYKTPNDIGDYRHLKYDKINKYQKEIFDHISKLNFDIKYNTEHYSLFSYVFLLNNTASCLSNTIIEFYIASRLRINDLQLIIKSVPNQFFWSNTINLLQTTPPSLIDKMTERNVLDGSVSHFETKIKDDICRNNDNLGISYIFYRFNLKEIILTFLGLIYDKYNYYNNYNSNNDYIFNYINRMNNDYKYYIENIVSQNYRLLQHIPDEEQKHNIDSIKQIILNNGLALQFVSKELQSNYDIVLTAVSQNGLALQFVSKELQSNSDIILVAVTQIQQYKLLQESKIIELNKIIAQQQELITHQQELITQQQEQNTKRQRQQQEQFTQNKYGRVDVGNGRGRGRGRGRGPRSYPLTP